MESYGHIIYASIFITLLIKKDVPFRTSALTTSVLAAFNEYHRGPNWPGLLWSLSFVCINSYFLFKYLTEKKIVKLNDTENFILEKNFPTMTKLEFKRLMNQGYSHPYYAPQKLIDDKSFPHAIFLILDGEVDVVIRGHKVSTLKSGDFIGEISFLTGQATSAAFILAKTSTIHYWDGDDLSAFLKKYPQIQTKFQNAIGSQLIKNHLKNHPEVFNHQDLIPAKKAA